VVGGLGFIAPAVILMLALSALFLARSPPVSIRGAGAGAGSAVAAVAVQAGLGLARPSWARASTTRGRQVRWLLYGLAGGAGAALIGPWLVLVLVGCGIAELAARRIGATAPRHTAWVTLLPATVSAGGIGSLAWVAIKVGALSFGGGFVIVPLMQHDAVRTYHWMTGTGFLTAVALGQVTPGPVVATVAAVGYAARGLGGGVMAAAIAFAPSFLLVLLGATQFDRLRRDERAQRFLDGAGPAAIGAILGAAVPLASALAETWQFILLGAAAIALLVARRGVVATLVAAGAIGAVVAVAEGPLPH
jgi:chromate transporter